jgi:hypothetical protein
VEEKMNSEIFGNHVISIKIEITWWIKESLESSLNDLITDENEHMLSWNTDILKVGKMKYQRY